MDEMQGFDGIFIHETDLAILFVPDDCVKFDHRDNPIWEEEDTIWLPKSQISYGEKLNGYERGDTIMIEMPEWLAEEKELI